MRKFKAKDRLTDRSSKALNLYFNEVSKYKMLSPEEEIVEIQKAQSGNQRSIDLIVKSNLRFVISVAKEYQSFGLTLEDLIQEGNLGLLKAIDKFQVNTGFKFISYAVWWIRADIQRAIQKKSRTIKLSSRAIQDNLKIEKIDSKFYVEHGFHASEEYLLKESNLEKSSFENSKYFNVRMDSVDSQLSENTNTTLGDMLGSDEFSPDTNILTSNSNSFIVNYLKSKLKQNEFDTINQIYGLETEAKPIKIYAEQLGLTKEAIRHRVKKILSKLNTDKILIQNYQ